MGTGYERMSRCSTGHGNVGADSPYWETAQTEYRGRFYVQGSDLDMMWNGPIELVVCHAGCLDSCGRQPYSCSPKLSRSCIKFNVSLPEPKRASSNL